MQTQKIVDETVKEIQKIPKPYLVKCNWFDYLSENLKDDKVDPKIVIKVHLDNMSIARECYLLHNSLIDFIINNNL